MVIFWFLDNFDHRIRRTEKNKTVASSKSNFFGTSYIQPIQRSAGSTEKLGYWKLQGQMEMIVYQNVNLFVCQYETTTRLSYLDIFNEKKFTI